VETLLGAAHPRVILESQLLSIRVRVAATLQQDAPRLTSRADRWCLDESYDCQWICLGSLLIWPRTHPKLLPQGCSSGTRSGDLTADLVSFEEMRADYSERVKRGPDEETTRVYVYMMVWSDYTLREDVFRVEVAACCNSDLNGNSTLSFKPIQRIRIAPYPRHLGDSPP